MSNTNSAEELQTPTKKRLRVARDPKVSIMDHMRRRRPGDVTLGDLRSDYRDHIGRTAHRSVSALATLDATLAHVAEFDTLAARDISVDHLLALKDAHGFQGLSGSTTRKVLSTLSSVFEYSWSIGACIPNPVRLIPRSELPSRAPRDDTRADMEVLELPQVRAILDDRLVLAFHERLLFGLLLTTGMRIGEAAGLTWGDLALEVGPLSGQIRIERSYDSKRHVMSPTKSGDPRLVPVTSQLRALLDEARVWFVGRWKREPTEHDVLCRYCPSRKGGEWRLWTEKAAIGRWRRVLPELGIPHPACGERRLHSTRHTFVTLALREDAQERALEPVTHVPRRGGERSSAIALYGHFNWNDSCRAVAKLQDAIARTDGAPVSRG